MSKPTPKPKKPAPVFPVKDSEIEAEAVLKPPAAPKATVAPDPLITEAVALEAEIVKASKDLKEKVAALRARFSDFHARLDPDSAGRFSAATEGAILELESALNKLDPDTGVR